MSYYVLDTNILLHNPDSLFSFGEANIIIPFTVIEELDNRKKGLDEVGKNARYVTRQLDQLRETGSLSNGVKLPNGGTLRIELNNTDNKNLPVTDVNKYDNKILVVAYNLSQKYNDLVFYTNDLNLRIKADVLGIKTKEFYDDKIDHEQLYDDTRILEMYSYEINQFYMDSKFKYEISNAYQNEFFILKSIDKQTHSGVCRYSDGFIYKLEHENENVFDLVTKNKEQKFAMELLMNKDIKIIALVGQAGTGKAQPLYSKIKIPNGWTTMGNVKVGDKVCTPDGKISNVIELFPQGKKDVYRITFDDGRHTDCCKDHLWKVYYEPWSKKEKVISLNELITMKESVNKGIYVSLPEVYGNYIDLPIDPYVIGFLLGDGSLTHSISVSGKDESIGILSEKIIDDYELRKNNGSKYDYYVCPKERHTNRTKGTTTNYYKKTINELGLNVNVYNKFIPDIYLESSYEQRMELIRGLMDTDGTIDKTGGITFSTSSFKLSRDFQYLIRSIGGWCKIKERYTTYTYKGEKKNGHISYTCRIRFKNPELLFTISYKKERCEQLTRRKKIGVRNKITSIEYIGQEECKCILIDHDDHLYITDDFIVTHNTLISLAAALEQVVNKNIYSKVLITRPMASLGQDIGFLKGDKDEKFYPWMGPIYDNMEYLFRNNSKKQARQIIDHLKDMGQVEMEPLTYMRGRSIPNQFIICDESQNMSKHLIKTLLTRIGENTKIVLTGDLEQIDTPYLDASSSGLSYVIERLKSEKLFGHVNLNKGERSEVAEICSRIL